MTSILDYYEIHVLPVVNPDGYEYSRLSGSVIFKLQRILKVVLKLFFNRQDYGEKIVE